MCVQVEDIEYSSLIRSCIETRDIHRGRRLHDNLISNKCLSNRYLCNLLVEMYGKCGSAKEAAQVFDRIQKPNIFSWNLLLAAYAHNGHLTEAKQLFDRMPLDIVSWNTMITACATSGEITQARTLFDRMPRKSTVSWNAMISAYAQNGHLQEARELFDTMSGTKNTGTWNTLLTAYAQKGHIQEAEEIFLCIPIKDIVSWTAMVTMYAQTGDLQQARDVFNKMPERNVVSWTTLIQAYAQNDLLEEASSLFDRMPERNSVTWNVMLVAYAERRHIDEAENIFRTMPRANTACHNAMLQAYVLNSLLEDARKLFNRMTEKDVISWTCMVSAYAQHGHIEEASNLFKQLPMKNSVSWNTMISAYARHGYISEAERLFESMSAKSTSSWTAMLAAYSTCSRHRDALYVFKLMDMEGFTPDTVTYTAVIGICSTIREEKLGREVHMEILESNIALDTGLQNSLVEFYGTVGPLIQAEDVFQSMKHPDVRSWTCMISAYTANSEPKQAVNTFARMDQAGVQPDVFTFTAVLEAGGKIASSVLADILEEELECGGNVPDVVVRNALMDLHGKCANLSGSKRVFDNMGVRDLVSWSTLMTAYVQNGCPLEALELLPWTVLEGFELDHVNFVTVLTACSHLGEFEKACEYFISISFDYHLNVVGEHYHCVVDLLARAGKLAEAEELVNCMPLIPGDVAWMSLLTGYRTHQKAHHAGSVATEHVKSKQSVSNSAAYIMLSNICTP